MEVAETQSCPKYDRGPPWLFKGSALYQLHLVKTEIAQSFIPKEFKLVEAFGYTLGGFFLAHYDDSPAGSFDELVVIAGIVWNPPTSCAWASRVLVNSHEACRHGRKFVGLPSHFANFCKVKSHSYARQGIVANSKKPKGRLNGFLDILGIGASTSIPKSCWDIQVTEILGSSETAMCNISLPTDGEIVSILAKIIYSNLSALVYGSDDEFYNRQVKTSRCLGVHELTFVWGLESKSENKWLGPAIQMSLPNFSGCTEENPNLLKYSCRINCRMRVVEPAKISGPVSSLRCGEDKIFNDPNLNARNLKGAVAENDALHRSISILLSKPILALQFDFLKMRVEAPAVVSQASKNVVIDP